MKFDASDITSNIGIEIEAAEQMVMEATTKLTLDAQAALMMATPVDTNRARSGWEATTPSEPYQPGIIENNVEYISYLNDGHSPQAPANFVETIVQRFNGGGIE